MSHPARMITRRFVLLAAIAFVGCGGGDKTTPAAPSQASPSTSTGFFPASEASLNYQLDLPAGRGPFPAVVFGHGSGQVTKSDGAVHVPFWLDQGFAVLRFDKRGSGQSTGTYRGVSAANSESQILELAGDMTAAVAFLKTRPEIDGSRIGLTGVSQAGWVMAAAASFSIDVRFVVAFVGSVVPVGVNIAYETRRDDPIDEAYAALAQYGGPRGYDPLPGLRATAAPVLYLLAADDRLVPTRACLPLIDDLRAGGARVSSRVYPGAGHEFGSSSRGWPDVAEWLRSEGLR